LAFTLLGVNALARCAKALPLASGSTLSYTRTARLSLEHH